MSEFAVIVSGNINNQEKVDAYKNVAGPIMKKYGATMPPQSFKVNQVLAGKSMPSFMLKIQFPNKESVMAVFDDPNYAAVIKERDEGFGDLSIFIIE